MLFSLTRIYYLDHVFPFYAVLKEHSVFLCCLWYVVSLQVSIAWYEHSRIRQKPIFSLVTSKRVSCCLINLKVDGIIKNHEYRVPIKIQLRGGSDSPLHINNTLVFFFHKILFFTVKSIVRIFYVWLSTYRNRLIFSCSRLASVWREVFQRPLSKKPSFVALLYTSTRSVSYS